MNKTKRVVPIKIELNDIITPKSCSIFIAELIKFIAFNKQQLPYPYERLKMFVMKRREHQKVVEDMDFSGKKRIIPNSFPLQVEEDPEVPWTCVTAPAISCTWVLSNSRMESATSQRVAFIMEKHYKKVEEAYNILNNTFKCIENELMQSAEHPVEEIILLFGATPISPRDVYRIQIPSLFFGHSDSQHIWRKQIGNLFREIILSDEVNANFQKKVGITNMFVMIKMKKGGCTSSQWLLPKDHYKLSDRAQEVCFSFKSVSSKPCSCSNITELEKLTQDMTALSISDDLMDSDAISDSMWYQTSKTLKGFRDCKSQGKSIIDLWYRHKFL